MTTPIFSDQPAVERQPTRGLCPVCGFLARIDDDGNVGKHQQIRIYGRLPDGKPREYRTGDDCDGRGCEPEQVA